MSIWALPTAFRMGSRTARESAREQLYKIGSLFCASLSLTPGVPPRLTLLWQFVVFGLSLHGLTPALHPLHLGLQEAQEELPVPHAGRRPARVGEAPRALQGRCPRPGPLRADRQGGVGTRGQVRVLMGTGVHLAAFTGVATLY